MKKRLLFLCSMLGILSIFEVFGSQGSSFEEQRAANAKAYAEEQRWLEQRAQEARERRASDQAREAENTHLNEQVREILNVSPEDYRENYYHLVSRIIVGTKQLWGDSRGVDAFLQFLERNKDSFASPEFKKRKLVGDIWKAIGKSDMSVRKLFAKTNYKESLSAEEMARHGFKYFTKKLKVIQGQINHHNKIYFGDPAK